MPGKEPLLLRHTVMKPGTLASQRTWKARGRRCVLTGVSLMWPCTEIDLMYIPQSATDRPRTQGGDSTRYKVQEPTSWGRNCWPHTAHLSDGVRPVWLCTRGEFLSSGLDETAGLSREGRRPCAASQGGRQEGGILTKEKVFCTWDGAAGAAVRGGDGNIAVPDTEPDTGRPCCRGGCRGGGPRDARLGGLAVAGRLLTAPAECKQTRVSSFEDARIRGAFGLAVA